MSTPTRRASKRTPMPTRIGTRRSPPLPGTRSVRPAGPWQSGIAAVNAVSSASSSSGENPTRHAPNRARRETILDAIVRKISHFPSHSEANGIRLSVPDANVGYESVGNCVRGPCERASEGGGVVPGGPLARRTLLQRPRSPHGESGSGRNPSSKHSRLRFVGAPVFVEASAGDHVDHRPAKPWGSSGQPPRRPGRSLPQSVGAMRLPAADVTPRAPARPAARCADSPSPRRPRPCGAGRRRAKAPSRRRRACRTASDR